MLLADDGGAFAGGSELFHGSLVQLHPEAGAVGRIEETVLVPEYLFRQVVFKRGADRIRNIVEVQRADGFLLDFSHPLGSRQEMRVGGRAEPGIDHAAAHYQQVGRHGDGHPFLRFMDAAGLGHLEEKAVHGVPFQQFVQVVELGGGFIGEYRHIYLAGAGAPARRCPNTVRAARPEKDYTAPLPSGSKEPGR